MRLLSCLLLTLCFVALPSKAAKWAAIGVSDGSNYDIDTDSIEVIAEARVVKAWFRENAPTYRKNPVGHYYRSAATREAFSCARRLTAVENAVYYSGPDLSGNLVDDIAIPVTEPDFTVVIPDSIGAAKLKKACEFLPPPQ